MGRYTVGVDFGTLSARALVVDADTGRELADAAMDYPHGVMTQALPDGTPLGPDWALAHPGDYLACLGAVIPEALKRAGVRAGDVAGLGIDATSSTALPVDGNNAPLCLKPEFARKPHAWMMLWKHHAAQDHADRMTDLAHRRGDAFLERYGGRVFSEWLFPRLWQILKEAPEVYAAADRFIDVGDWLVQRITGTDTRAGGIAGYKCFWNRAEGFPEAFLAAVDPRLAAAPRDKLRGTIKPIGSLAGRITGAGSALTGLVPGTPVAAANIDAHVSMPALGRAEPGDLMMILGTSGCHILVGDALRCVPGICGVVDGGILPGMIGYEAGQSCVGDMFAWYVDHGCPAYVHEAARAGGMDAHRWLTDRAARLRPGESGLMALDWWNGNRSVLADAGLTGLMLGMTLSTRPEEIYRALIEATAYGTRVILENFERNGVPVKRVFACGGIARKNPLLLRIYADVLDREISVVRTSQAGALGSAIFAAAAAGLYPSVAEAAGRMGGAGDEVSAPETDNVRIYDALYREYLALHDHFGRGGSDAMKRLRRIREAACRFTP